MSIQPTTKLIYKSYKVRIYPTQYQQELINKTFGSCRFVYNYFLSSKLASYREEGVTCGYSDLAGWLPSLKQEYPWLKEVDSVALQQSLRDLDSAFKKFFASQNKFPKFKKKFDKQSYRTINNQSKQTVRVEGNRVRIPKVGFIRFKDRRSLKGRITSATISKTVTNKYFISLLVETNVEEKVKLDKNIGIDLGLSTFATDSNGVKYANPRYYRKEEETLAKLQRYLSQKVKHSKNYNRLKLKIARLHEKVSNRRFDFLHKLSSKLINENQVIVIEDLQIKNMIKNRNLAKSIQDASWGLFGTLLAYKASWFGRDLIKVSPFYPSSKLCNVCKTRNESLQLNERIWECENCGKVNDRDYNASKNILEEGLRIFANVKA